MKNLFLEIEELFKTIPEYCDDDNKLLKNKIIDAANNLDENVIQLLLENESAKNHFFKKIGDIVVFDKIKFQRFLNNKEFLPDSFTAFKNKIGLTVDNKYLNESNDVVLSWAYKDCILEGGQDDEDAKRGEIFYNETLAPDEIDALLKPKALVNFKKYDANGESVPDKVTKDDNLIIKGNNLLAMHTLKKNYAGQIKLIYIDPPYNTGSDSFKYNDKFNHSTWLTFMKNRLEIAKELLRDDGVIFVQVDDGEHSYLKLILDQVFGRTNFKANIILKSSTESGVNAVNVKRGERLFKVKENILMFSKQPTFRFNPFFMKTSFNKNYKYEVVNNGEEWEIKDLSDEYIELKDLEKYALNNPNDIYSLESNLGKAGDTVKRFAAQNKQKKKVEEFVNSFGEKQLYYKGGVLVPLKDRIVTEDNINSFGVWASDLWVDIGTTPSSEGGVKFENGKKPEKLLSRIIEMGSAINDIILDFHLGSGTTAAVAHKLNRRYIGIEQMEYIENITLNRLQNVIKGDNSGISKTVDWKGGGSFVYCELAQSNQEFVDKITNTETKEDLMKIWKEMQEKAFLSYKFNKYDAEEKELAQFQSDLESLELDDLKRFLFAVLDKNMLYVPLTEIEDKTYNINELDIALNKSFFGEA